MIYKTNEFGNFFGNWFKCFVDYFCFNIFFCAKKGIYHVREHCCRWSITNSTADDKRAIRLTNVSPFTIVLFDKDAPTSKAQGLSYLHWAKSGNDVIIPYQGPTPPPLTGTHTYRFNLYDGLINHIINEKRDQFDIEKLDSELKKFDSVYFTVDSS